MTRLQARISSLERAADLQNLYNQTVSLSAGHNLTHSPGGSSTTLSPKKTETLNTHTHSACLGSPGHTRCQPTSAPLQSHDWLRNSSTQSSLDLPPSLKATLSEALSKEPWASSSSSVSPFPGTVDQSWQGLSGVEATASSDLSFNPLTYMVDKQDDSHPNSTMQEGDEWTSESRRASVRTLVGEEQEMDMSSLTGMLRFVNQTLAMQEDPSLWSSTGLSNT